LFTRARTNAGAAVGFTCGAVLIDIADAVATNSCASTTVDAAAAIVGDRPTVIGTTCSRNTACALIYHLVTLLSAAGSSTCLAVEERVAYFGAVAEQAVITVGVVGDVVTGFRDFIARIIGASNAVVTIDRNPRLTDSVHARFCPVTENPVSVDCTFIAYYRWASAAVCCAVTAVLEGVITVTVAAGWLTRTTVGNAIGTVLTGDITRGALTDTVSAYCLAWVTVRLAVGAVLAEATDVVAAADGTVLGTRAEGFEPIAQSIGTNGFELVHVQHARYGVGLVGHGLVPKFCTHRVLAEL
jgi:hypothetical protein